jgi:hypothetical protein
MVKYTNQNTKNKMNYKEWMDASYSERAKYIFSVNDANGFWDKDSEGNPTRNRAEAACLILSELLEAKDAEKFAKLEPVNTYFTSKNEFKRDYFKANVKDSFEDEIGDAVIRALDALHGFNVESGVLDYLPVFLNEHNALKDLNTLYEEIAVNYLVQYVDFVREGQDRDADETLIKITSLIIAYGMRKLGNYELLTHMYLKIQYNATRGYKHGKKF